MVARCEGISTPNSAPFEMIERLDVQRRAKLVLELRPKLGQSALGDHVLEVGARRGEDAVIAVELPIGEPEAVVGARVEPAEIVILGTLSQDRRGRADIVGDTVDELQQIVAARVEYGLRISPVAR